MGSIKGIDLFCGAGGLTLGLKEAGVVTVCAVDFEPYRLKTFATHSPDADIKQGDIRSVDFRQFRGKVDLVYGGPPCQPFSSGGLRAAGKDSRDMIPEYLRVVREVEPAAFLMENVPGLAVGERAKYLGKIIAEFESLGYLVAWKILNAADFGVPQKRRRLFVVGLRERRFMFPAETHGPGRLPYVTAGDVLTKEPVGEPNPSRVYYAKTPDLRPSPYDGHLFNGGGRAVNMSQPSHTVLASAGGNKTHFVDVLGLVPEYHEYLGRGGKPRQGVVPGARRLTVVESAILQTFPRGLRFQGPRSAQYHQVGDAVPPDLGAALGRSLVAQMLGETRILESESAHRAPQQWEMWNERPKSCCRKGGGSRNQAG